MGDGITLVIVAVVNRGPSHDTLPTDNSSPVPSDDPDLNALDRRQYTKVTTNAIVLVHRIPHIATKIYNMFRRWVSFMKCDELLDLNNPSGAVALLSLWRSATSLIVPESSVESGK